MAPLEDLERDYPMIDSDFRMFCASHGIFTGNQASSLYNRESTSTVAKWSGFIRRCSTQQVYSIDRCGRIDVLLQGGLREGHVIELVGPSSSCKTQVCLKAASHVAGNYLGKVIYFDTGNSFSPNRVVQFLSLSSDPSTTEVNKTVQRVMSSIIDCQVKMLIIDSLSSLIAPVLGGGGSQGHALMVTAGFLLKELAHEYNISVVVTNHMVAGEAGISKPALGESWKSIPHVRLLLSRNYSSNGSCITILKHPSLATGKSTDFVVM